MKTTKKVELIFGSSQMRNFRSSISNKQNFRWLVILLFGLAAQLGAQAQTQVPFTANGTFIVPLGVTSVQVEAWGAGGAGGGSAGTGLSGTNIGGGGAGGAYTKVTSSPVSSGSSMAVTVGQGGAGVDGAAGGAGGNSTFGSVTATGGGGGKLGNATGALTAGATGTTNGGTGAAAASGNSGGGGGGAGSTAAGGNGGAPAAGAGGVSGGGIGGAGRNSSGDGNAAGGIGGGGGGARSNGFFDGANKGGAGFAGKVIITYTCPTYALTSATTATGPFCGASASVVTLRSASLVSGAYTVTYNLSGATTASGTTASVNFTAGTPGSGSFTTASLNAGTTTITITGITSASCTSAITANHTATVTVTPATTAAAGGAFSVCAPVGAINITTGSSATNASTITWTSNGSGTIANADSMTLATYTPSASEIASGAVVTLTLTARASAPCANVVVNKVLTINGIPTAEAGGSQTICSNGTATVSGASATNGTITWTENGAGTISGGSTLTPTYTPAAGDAGNTVTLTMTVSNSSCPSATATYLVTVNGAATAVAGTAIVVCENAGAVNITDGATATNNAGITWTSTGSGTFSNSNSLTLATYSPSIADINAGSVTLTLTASGNLPCANATSSKTFTIRKSPTASAGGSATICQNQTATVSGASSSNGTVSWTENGAGSITAGATTLTPTYTAAAGDAGNAVTLTMTVSNSPCATASASYIINVLAAPTANAGTAVTMCANAGSVNITAGATASNFSSVTWTSNGTGIFTNGNSLTLGSYAPSVADQTAGNVTLTLSANGNGSCANVIATKVLTILPVPVVTNVAICAGQPSTSLTSATNCPISNSISSGVRSAGTGATTGTGTAWSTPGNITADDAAVAVFSGSVGFDTSNLTSQVLAATNFGFTIPANAIIGGIQATIVRTRSGTAASGEISDNNVRIIKGGALTGTNKAISGNWSTTETPASYGNATDLWGATWSAADINASNFGIGLVANLSVTLGVRNANVDNVSISVTYKVPGELRWYTVSSGGSAIATGSSFNPVGVTGSGLTNTNVAGTKTYYVECSTIPGCRTPANFTINPLPVVNFTTFAPFYCQDAAAVNLVANQNGGTFTGVGITNNGNGNATFNPATAGVGSHTITYSYTDGNTCVNTTSQIVKVNANVTYYADADNDTFGNITMPSISCNGAPTGYVANNTDCDDTNAAMHQTFPFYVDSDGDGFGTGSLVNVCAVNASTPPANYSLNNTDCNPANPAFHAEYPFYADTDGDTYGTGDLVNVCAINAGTPPTGYCLNNTDCNPSDAAYFNKFEFYVDADGDGFGAGALVEVCALNASTPPSLHSLNNTDCDDTQASVNPNAPEIGYNLVDDDCDGTIDEGFPPIVSSVLLCNNTLSAIDTYIYASLVANASGYRWRITTMSGPTQGQVQYLNTSLRAMRITQLGTYAFNTTYKAEVAVYYAGYLQPYTLTDCTVNTPATVTQLASCGDTPAVLNLMSDAAYANAVPFATGYKFKITDPTNPANTVEIIRPLREFRMSLITTFPVMYNKIYNVQVAVRNTDGTYLPYGPACSLKTPIFPTTSLQDSQCDDYMVPTATTQIYASSYPNVVKYVFKVEGPGMPAGGFILLKSLRSFSLSEVPGLQSSTNYDVTVRMIFNMADPDGPFGKTCSVITPPAAKSAAGSKAIFSAVAYPNPFADSFNIDITTPASTKIDVKVYDMTGRLLEVKNGDISEMKTLHVGDNYPSGVYNVIVTQDDNVKTLRVIKR